MLNKNLLPLLILVLVLVQGCASLQHTAEGEPVEREKITAFELEGRFSASDGERAANGRIHWEHAPQRDVLTFFNPMGQIAARLTRSDEGAMLRMANGEVYRAPDADELLPDLLGVRAPVDSLAYWVQGIVGDSARVLQYDAVGRPARINDQGWIVNYAEYADDTVDAAPRRLDATRGDARMRLIINRWTPEN